MKTNKSKDPNQSSYQYDWKNVKRGWQYKEDPPHDKEWQKDRLELFRESGNGWWWFQGAPPPKYRK